MNELDIAIKYVRGQHDALTDKQEIKDMAQDILEFAKNYALKQSDNVDLASVVGSFSSDDIKEVYEIGRGHEKNRSDCTSEMIKKAWGKADNMYKNINWE